MFLKVRLDSARKFFIRRSEDLACHFHDGRFEAAMDQILGHLQPDEAAANNHGAELCFRGLNGRAARCNPFVDVPGVGHRADMEDAGQVYPRQRRPDGRRARRQNQLVVGMLRNLAGPHIAQLDLFLRRQNLNSLAIGPDIDGKPFAEQLRGRDQEARFLLDDAADMIWQSAVRVGNVGAALHHQDFGILVQPAQARRARCAASHSTYDDDLHGPVPFSCEELARSRV